MTAKHGSIAYASVMRGLQLQGATAREIAIRHGWCDCSARHLLRQLHSLGLLHVAGWRRIGRRGPWDRVYGAGEGEDAPPPMTSKGKVGHLRPPKKIQPRPALIAFATLWNSLSEPSTAKQILEETGFGQQVLYRFFLHGRKIRAVRVAGWTRSGAQPVMLFALGSAPDVPRPLREPKILIQRRQRRRSRERAIVARLGHMSAPVYQAAA